MQEERVVLTDQDIKTIRYVKKQADKSTGLIGAGIFVIMVGLVISVGSILLIGYVDQSKFYILESIFVATVGIILIRDALEYRKIHRVIQKLSGALSPTTGESERR